MEPGEFLVTLLAIVGLVALLIFAGYIGGVTAGRADCCIAAGYDEYDDGMKACIVQTAEGNYRAVEYEVAFRMVE